MYKTKQRCCIDNSVLGSLDFKKTIFTGLGLLDFSAKKFHRSWITYGKKFCNGESALLVAFVKYTLSKLYSHCTQNCNFYYFLETIICFVTKNCSIPSQVCVFIFSKISKNDSRKLESVRYALSFSVHNIPSHFYDLNLA